MWVSSYKDMLVQYTNVNVTEGKILPDYCSDLRSGYFVSEYEIQNRGRILHF